MEPVTIKDLGTLSPDVATLEHLSLCSPFPSPVPAPGITTEHFDGLEVPVLVPLTEQDFSATQDPFSTLTQGQTEPKLVRGPALFQDDEMMGVWDD